MIGFVLAIIILLIMRGLFEIVGIKRRKSREEKLIEDKLKELWYQTWEDKSHKRPDYTKPSEKRKFKIGDVILYDERGQQFNVAGNIDFTITPYTRTGIMLINGFDYDADCAARCSVGRSAIGLKGTVYGDYAPCANRYRKAKKHHIKKFIKDICKDEIHCKIYEKEIKYLATLI